MNGLAFTGSNELMRTRARSALPSGTTNSLVSALNPSGSEESATTILKGSALGQSILAAGSYTLPSQGGVAVASNSLP